MNIFVGFVALQVFFLVHVHASALNVVDVRRFHAKGDMVTENSMAFLSAWRAACSTTGASAIVVPRGVFKLAPVSFSGPCKSTKITFLINGHVAATNKTVCNSHFWLQFKNVDGLSIEGSGGVLHGHGETWWKHKNWCESGPRTIHIAGSKNVLVRHLTFINSKQMHMVFDDCKNVIIQSLDIIAPGDSPNTDGIHLQRSDNVHITGVSVHTGDDCISIGPGTTNVMINNVHCGPGHGISIGSLGKKKGEEAGVYNVSVNGAYIADTQNGVRIKTWQGGNKGFARSISFQNVEMSNVNNPILIDQHYCPHHNHDCSAKPSQVKISDVVFRNIHGSSANKNAIQLNCSEASPCERITLHNVNLIHAGHQLASSMCSNVHGVSMNVQPRTTLTN